MSVPPSFRHLARTTHARRFTIILSLVFVAALAVPFVSEGARDGSSEPAPRNLRHTTGSKPDASGAAAEFVPGSLLVRFRTETAARRAEGSPAAGRGMILDGAEGQIGATVTRFEGSDLVRGLRLVRVEPDQTLAAVEAFKSRPDVLYAEPDYVRRVNATPTETEFTNMWALKNTGQFIVDHFNGGPNGTCPSPPCTFGGGSPGADIKATQAWDITTGSSNIVVGVIDEGVDINHPDLKDNIFVNPAPGAVSGFVNDVNGWNFTSCGANSPTGCGSNVVFAGNGTYPTDQTDAHGTHVSGTIGARANNNASGSSTGQGVVGINWNVKILPLKFLDASGGGSSSNAIRAMAYAKAMRDLYISSNGTQGANVRVLNNSYGGGGFLQSERDSIRSLATSDILFVVAAGNDLSNNDFIPSYPANYDAPNLISVAATTRNDVLDPFYSNYGARTVHIAAPGSLILSTTPNNTYDFYYGTSMATPHVAGVAALALAENPNLTVQQLRSIILYNGTVNVTNFAQIYSQRRLNAFGTVQAAQEILNNADQGAPAAPGNLQIASQNGRSVTLQFIAPGDDGSSGNASLFEISFVSNTDGKTYLLKTAFPHVPGTIESIGVNVPLRQTSGTLRVKAFDNVGNESLATVGVSVAPLVADPYATAETTNTGLAAFGTPLGFHQDDGYMTVNLPSGFSFPFFGQSNSSVVISSNGNIYLQPQNTLPPADPNNDQFADSGNSIQQLEGFKMIAGLWDDLRTDCTTGGTGAACDVYENTSDPNKVIFRWEARTFATTANNGIPVEFEIELDRDGTIITRYGGGTNVNTNVNPVVGIGAGEQGASYVINSHTSAQGTGAPISLTNAPTVTYTVRTASAPPPTLQFSAASYTFGEGNITPQGTNAAQVVVTRAGDTSSSASVDVRTVDNAAPVACSDTTTLPGVAFARCDYETVVTTVSWAAGDAQPKTVTIPLVNDSFVEPNESFNVVLVNQQGATLSTPSTTTVTITDNDVAGEQNPIFGTDFFIRQQYLDFLAREPDAAGFASWQGLLNGCPNPFNIAPNNSSSNCDRVTVSANFFLSAEFQLKGAYVFRFYKLSFGRLPLYTEFTPDTASVTGATAQEVFDKKAAFANAWVQRSGFVSQYGGLDSTQFVNALMDRYSLASVTTPDPINPDGSTKITMSRADMINRLNGAGSALTRAQVVRAIADSDEVSAREQNAAFVAMQYFGYLRRDPDTQGFNDWNTYLAAHPGDVRTMVVGFVTSGEYFQRFGQP